MRGELGAALVMATSLSASAAEPRLDLLRQVTADVATTQAKSPDPHWDSEQRDCAGLVRFSYRQAYKRVAPERLKRPLFMTARGPSDFADAETLLGFSFISLGRDDAALKSLRSGDLVAFRQPREEGDAFHLMLVVTPADKAHLEPYVVYHPGEKDSAVRVGTLSELTRDAPGEWRPTAANPSFLGFFRFKEWQS